MGGGRCPRSYDSYSVDDRIVSSHKSRSSFTANGTHGWRDGTMIERRTYDREVASSIPGQGTAALLSALGKLFTPNCLNAGNLSYYMESLNIIKVPLSQMVHGRVHLCGQ